MLALAYKVQQAIDRGVLRGRVQVARRLGLMRARVTQLLDLTLLAPDIQEKILFAESVDGVKKGVDCSSPSGRPAGPSGNLVALHVHACGA